MSELLVWCARRFVGDGRVGPPVLDALDDEGWRSFIRAAMRHSCLPIAWRTLESQAGVPSAVATDLRVAFEANSVRNLRLAGELVTVTRRLAQAGIESVSWKGPLLAERAYGDLRMRQFFDLDLFVRPTDLHRATELLASLEFTPEHDLNARQLASYVEHMGELELVRQSDGLWFELHTAVVPSYFGRGRQADDLWRRLRPARLARADVLALDVVDELEALCVHGSKHLWERLEWIVDIALMVKLLGNDDWLRLDTGSRRRGTRRMVDTALLLAASVCGARVPADWLEHARADHVVRRLATLARRGLFAPQRGRSDELRFHVQMWDRPLDRVRYLANVAFVPSVADWQFVNLPPALAPLYPLVRPLRMAADWVRPREPDATVSAGREHR